MDDNTRQRLDQKRTALQRRHAEHEARRTVAELTDALDRAGDGYALYLPDSAEERAAAAWLTDHFPHAFSGIDWSKVARQQRLADAAELYRVPLDARAVVQLVWSSANRPLVALTFSAAQRHLRHVASVDWDTFIIAPSVGICIELYHEGDITVGFAGG